MNPITISVVSYLNSKPFIHGLRNYSFSNPIDIQLDIPSACADKVISGKADVGLVPVAALTSLENYQIISDYCVGSDGDVASVLLLSDVPLTEIENILLDYQSRTSVQLAKLLAKEFWKINPTWVATEIDFENRISGTTAAVIIGDRALRIKNKFNYAYDLSGEWKKMTGLPFVFACWTTLQKLNPVFLKEFNQALKNGILSIDALVGKMEDQNIGGISVTDYLKKKINYDFDIRKKEALKLFLDFIK